MLPFFLPVLISRFDFDTLYAACEQLYFYVTEFLWHFLSPNVTNVEYVCGGCFFQGLDITELVAVDMKNNIKEGNWQLAQKSLCVIMT